MSTTGSCVEQTVYPASPTAQICLSTKPPRFWGGWAHTLAKSLHSIRHRTRSTSDPRAPSNEFAELEKANWDEDWQRIQYKSTPTRIGAVWFRAETGDCRISDSGGNNLCPDAHQNGYTAENVLKGNYPNHPAIATLRADHTGFDPKTLARSLKVLDYRYRIELQKSNLAVFEMSLDQVRTTTLADGMTKTTYEAELEIVKDNFDEEDVEELFRLVKELEKKYNSKPSTKTKGGIEVPEASSPSHP